MSSGNEVQLQQQDEDESHLASPLRRLSDLAHGHGQASPNQTTLKAHQEKPQVRVLPKWQIVSAANTPAGSGQPPQRRIASLKPGSAPQKATLLTKSGPQDVCILKSKAISCPRTGRYRCPVPNCKIDGRSRVGVAKHFRRDHKDYRSWRDVFIKRDAPDFILRNNEGQENTLGPHQQENPNPEQQGLLMISEGLDNCQPSDSSADPITRPFLPNAAAVQHQAQAVIIPTAPQAFPYPSSYFGANQVIYIQPVLPATFQPESQAIFVQMAPGQPLTSQFVIQPTNTTHSSSLQVMPASVALAAPAMSFHQQQLEGNSTTRLNSSPQTPQPILLQPSNNLVFGSQDGHTFVTVVPQAQTFSVNMP